MKSGEGRAIYSRGICGEDNEWYGLLKDRRKDGVIIGLLDIST